MIGEILNAKEIAELRDADKRTLIALHNVEVMGQSCLRVGDSTRSDEIFEVVVDELEHRGTLCVDGTLIDAPTRCPGCSNCGPPFGLGAEKNCEWGR